MSLYQYLLFGMISLTYVSATGPFGDVHSVSKFFAIYPVLKRGYENHVLKNEVHTDQEHQQDKVVINEYYESMCKWCRIFAIEKLIPTVKRIGEYLEIHAYPYGRAKTIVNNGKVEFVCPHGPGECYGNKLHGCTLEKFKNHTRALFFNACMMKYDHTNNGSDDEAADKCGRELNIDPEPIKFCAKSPQATKMLKRYGEETSKITLDAVPYVLVNGMKYNSYEDFFRTVCNAFTTQPARCINNVVFANVH